MIFFAIVYFTFPPCHQSPAGSQNSQTSGDTSGDGMSWSPESYNGMGSAPAKIVLNNDRNNSILSPSIQGSNPSFNVGPQITKVPQTPSSAPPIPILIRTDEDDKTTLKDIFFPPGFSSDISVVTAVQQQQLLSRKHPLSSLVISRYQEENDNFRNSSSPASIAKHLQSLRPVYCPDPNVDQTKPEPDSNISYHAAPQQISPVSLSQNEFRISQLKIVSNGSTSSAVS